MSRCRMILARHLEEQYSADLDRRRRDWLAVSRSLPSRIGNNYNYGSLQAIWQRPFLPPSPSLFSPTIPAIVAACLLVPR